MNKNTNNVYLRCLPRGFTEPQLIELCEPYGELTCTRLRESGVAFVRYRKAEDAQNAIRQLNGKRFDDHNELLLAKLANSDPFQPKIGFKQRPFDEEDGISSVAESTNTMTPSQGPNDNYNQHNQQLNNQTNQHHSNQSRHHNKNLHQQHNQSHHTQHHNQYNQHNQHNQGYNQSHHTSHHNQGGYNQHNQAPPHTPYGNQYDNRGGGHHSAYNNHQQHQHYAAPPTHNPYDNRYGGGYPPRSNNAPPQYTHNYNDPSQAYQQPTTATPQQGVNPYGNQYPQTQQNPNQPSNPQPQGVNPYVNAAPYYPGYPPAPYGYYQPYGQPAPPQQPQPPPQQTQVVPVTPQTTQPQNNSQATFQSPQTIKSNPSAPGTQSATVTNPQSVATTTGTSQVTTSQTVSQQQATGQQQAQAQVNVTVNNMNNNNNRNSLTAAPIYVPPPNNNNNNNNNNNHNQNASIIQGVTSPTTQPQGVKGTNGSSNPPTITQAKSDPTQGIIKQPQILTPTTSNLSTTGLTATPLTPEQMKALQGQTVQKIQYIPTQVGQSQNIQYIAVQQNPSGQQQMFVPNQPIILSSPPGSELSFRHNPGSELSSIAGHALSEAIIASGGLALNPNASKVAGTRTIPITPEKATIIKGNPYANLGGQISPGPNSYGHTSHLTWAVPVQPVQAAVQQQQQQKTPVTATAVGGIDEIPKQLQIVSEAQQQQQQQATPGTPAVPQGGVSGDNKENTLKKEDENTNTQNVNLQNVNLAGIPSSVGDMTRKTSNPHHVSKDYANKLHAVIKGWYPDKAGKLTGMFLQNHDQDKVVKYLGRPEKLRKKIDTFVKLLSTSNNKTNE